MQGSLFTCGLLSIYLRCILCIESCDHTRSVLAVEHGNAIFQLNKSGINDVSWLLGGRHIATSKPKKHIDIKSVNFKSRLQGMPDGSMKITNIRMKDRGTYAAHIFMVNNTDLIQCYSLGVQRKLSKDDIQILPNTSQNESCPVSLTCKVNRADVTVSWNNDIRKELPATNSTLSLKNVKPNVTLVCTAKNLASQASVVVRPWIYCQEERARPEAIQSLILMGIPVLVIAFFGCLLYRIKSKKIHRDASAIKTVCAQVERSTEEIIGPIYSVITPFKTPK